MTVVERVDATDDEEFLRIGRDVAALVRGDIPYGTGQVLKIDGGMTIRSM